MLGHHLPQGAEQDPGPGQAAAAHRRPHRQGAVDSLTADVKGDAYEGLLEKNAQDTKGGAGQYFTPRALIRAIVEVIRPQPGERDLRSGVRHGRLPARRARLRRRREPAPGQGAEAAPRAARHFTASRWSTRVTRLCAMNLLLHGIGPDRRRGRAADGQGRQPGCRSRPALPRSSSPTRRSARSRASIGRDRGGRRASAQALTITREDFWATTSNKQLNFVQHVKTMLEMNGRAAVVVPDNVLFEGGAGETVRRRLLHDCDVHTLLRLPTGIFYAQGVKANVLFFERKPAQRDAVDEEALDLRSPHQPALHAQDEPADAGPISTSSSPATSPRNATSGRPPGPRRTRRVDGEPIEL